MCIFRRLFAFGVMLDQISSNFNNLNVLCFRIGQFRSFIKGVQNIRSCATGCHHMGLSLDAIAKVLFELSFHMFSTLYVGAFFAKISTFFAQDH